MEKPVKDQSGSTMSDSTPGTDKKKVAIIVGAILGGAALIATTVFGVKKFVLDKKKSKDNVEKDKDGSTDE